MRYDIYIYVIRRLKVDINWFYIVYCVASECTVLKVSNLVLS